MALATTPAKDRASEPARPARADTVVLALILAWVATCFAPTLGFGFVRWDDVDFVLKNPLLVAPGSVPWSHQLTTPEVGYPVPVTLLTYRIEHALVGFDHPWVQHGVNVAIHLLNVALVFGLARRLRLPTMGAALAAICFGLHPIVSEPVAWVTGRKDLLALGFGLLTLRLALAAPSRTRRLAQAVAFGLALFSKPVAVALVPMLVLLSAARTPPSLPWPRRLAAAARQEALEILVAAVYLPLAWTGYHSFGATRSDEGLATSLRSAWYGLGAHLALVLGIEPPCVQHPTPGFPPAFTARIDLLPVGVAVGVGLLLRSLDRTRRGLVAAAIACSLLAYLPSSGLVPIKRFLADSYVYPALPGLAIALATSVEALRMRWPSRWPAMVLLPGLAVCLGLLLIPAAGRFRTTAALWADARESYPDSSRMCRNWAVAMQEGGGARETLAATDECIARFGPATFEKNRAVALFELGRLAEAAAWMRQAQAREPGDRNAPPALLRLAQSTGSEPSPP